MKIKTSCPSCMKTYNVPATAVGRKATCNSCGSRFVVENADGEFGLAPLGDVEDDKGELSNEEGATTAEPDAAFDYETWDSAGDGPNAGRLRASAALAIGTGLLWLSVAWINSEGSVPIWFPLAGSLAFPFGIVGLVYPKLFTHDPNNAPAHHRGIVVGTLAAGVGILIYVLFGVMKLF